MLSIATFAASVAVPRALAAQPVAGGRYEGKTLALTLSDDGRSLSLGQRTFAGEQLLDSAVRYPPCGGIARRGRFFRGAVRIEQNESGTNRNGTRFLTYDIYYGSGQESWNYYTSGPRKGSWGGPFRVVGSKLAELVIADARMAAPVRIGPDGKFSLDLTRTGSHGRHVRLRLVGKFTSRTSAAGRLRVWTRQPRGRRCDTGWQRFRDVGYTGEQFAARGPCDGPGRTLATASGLRLYEAPFRSGRLGWDDEYDLGIRSVAILCSESLQLRRIFDIERSGSESAYRWALTPDYFAQFGAYNCDAICINYLAVNPLRGSGGRMAGNCETTPPACNVQALVLTAAGALAWTDQSGRKKIVAASRPDGEARTLDSGSGIDVTSLALAGNTVRWTDQGQTRSAELR